MANVPVFAEIIRSALSSSSAPAQAARTAVVDTLERDFEVHDCSNCDPLVYKFAQPLLVWRVPRRSTVSQAQAAARGRESQQSPKNGPRILREMTDCV